MSKNSHKNTMCGPSELSGSEAPQTMLPVWESLVSESLFNHARQPLGDSHQNSHIEVGS